MTLEIPTELQTQLERAARERGADAREFALEAMQRGLETTAEPPVKAARNAALLRLRGSAKNDDYTVDDFLAERSAEVKKEAGL